MFTFASGCRALEHRILYAPAAAAKRWVQPQSAELTDLCFEDVYFSSLDGTKLHGWYVKPVGMEPANVILFAHGRTGNISGQKDRLFEFVRRHGVAVMVFDYRGYGKSEGRPSETGLYDDITAARNWLSESTGASPSEIILMGRSLGSAVAIDLASRDGAKALIVENGFTSVADVLEHHTHHVLKGGHLENRFDSASKIGKFSGPVFISHGQRDKAIPFSQGVRLAGLATSASRVHFVKLEGGHLTKPTTDYETTLDEFLKSL
jgi:pimeloyl-ACP methyl ester carboxylesterase